MGERKKYGLSRVRKAWEIKKGREVSLTSRKTVCCYLSYTNLLCPHLQILNVSVQDGRGLLVMYIGYMKE